MTTPQPDDDSPWRRPADPPADPTATPTETPAGASHDRPGPEVWARSASGDAAATAGEQPDAAEPRTPPPVAPRPPDQLTDTGSMPIPMPPVSRPPAGSAYGYPARYAEAPGSGHFQLALPQLGTIVAGPAIGSMIAGIAAILAAFSVGCTALFNTVMIPVAATVLVLFCVGAAGLLASVALRQIKRGGGEYRGKGMAVAGIACAGTAMLLLFGMAVLVVLTF